MKQSNLLALAGSCAVMGGGLRIIAAFVPWRANSLGLEAFYFSIDLLLLFGLLGIYSNIAARVGVLGLAGFAFATAGLASIVGPDPVAFGIEFYAIGSAIFALGLALIGASMLLRRVASSRVAVVWIAIPLLAAGASAVGEPETGMSLAGVMLGASFADAGIALSAERWNLRSRVSSAVVFGIAIAAGQIAQPAIAAPNYDPTHTNEVKMELNQVTLPARNLAESIDYYTRFGLTLIVDSPENQYARFEIPGGQSTLSVHVADGRVVGPAVHVYFETANPERKIADLHEKGIDPVEALEDKPWLWREAWYEDPAGNRLCIYFAGENRKNPPWRVKD